jgi:hypothetical protein
LARFSASRRERRRVELELSAGLKNRLADHERDLRARRHEASAALHVQREAAWILTRIYRISIGHRAYGLPAEALPVASWWGLSRAARFLANFSSFCFFLAISR